MRFAIPSAVAKEIGYKHPEQVIRLQCASDEGHIAVLGADESPEPQVFAASHGLDHLGLGELATFAVADASGCSTAIDDKSALEAAKNAGLRLNNMRTQDLIASMIDLQLLSVPEADKIKDEWKQWHKFNLKFDSFRDFLKTLT